MVKTTALFLMGIDSTTPYGAIQISSKAIATVAGRAVLECYGVAGLASKDPDQDFVAKSDDDFSHGIFCHDDGKNGYVVIVYVYVAYGVKITEVANSIQNKVRYVLEKTFSIPFRKVDVYVQNLKDIESV